MPRVMATMPNCLRLSTKPTPTIRNVTLWHLSVYAATKH